MSTDTDVFILLLYFSSELTKCTELKFEIGVDDKRRLIAIHALLQSLGTSLVTNVTALFGFHAFKDCDSTNAFVCLGKSKPFKLVLESEELQKVFQELGEQEDLPDKTKEDFRRFACVMYGSHI